MAATGNAGGDYAGVEVIDISTSRLTKCHQSFKTFFLDTDTARK